MVAKDSKRKRKESPPPTAVESSPEMPKRTKVQAQRKFAQGQGAPASSYSSLIAASSSSNTGPSTSSESREPPTEILPNKRPKTEDFLTFLCFRGTSALPAHLDYLNQGKSKETETTTVKKIIAKPIKPVKKGKKGRPPKNTAKTNEFKATTSAATKSENNDVLVDKEEKPIAACAATVKNSKDATATVATKEDNPSPPFAVRKRADIVTDGNRRGVRLRNNATAAADADKCNKAPETKRRTQKNNAKDAKSTLGNDTEDEDEYFSANDDGTAAKADESDKEPASNATVKNETKKSIKSPVESERKSETPSKESETNKSRRGRIAAKKVKEASKENNNETTNAKSTSSPTPILKIAQKAEQSTVKEKAPVKRQRQKESPIFIPSPEPSGRMTRQRAFFEPVKVPHRDDESTDEIEKSTKSDAKTEADNENEIKTELDESAQSKKSKTNTNNVSASIKNDSNVENGDTSKEKSNLNVFDFSSDDEQPLAKQIKLKKTKAGAKKSTTRVNKPGRKPSPKKATDNAGKTAPTEASKKEESADDNKEETHEHDEVSKSKNKRGRATKKKVEERNSAEIEQGDALENSDKELMPPSPKKSAANARQSRKKAKTEAAQVANGEEQDKDTDATNAPVRSQRPTRKTKEAAAIYMGIIGHKLQLADDEDDDLSLNSFPDLPNVKEMEKMEIELKRHAAQTAKPARSTPTVLKTATKQATSATTVATPVIAVEKPTTGRRGRPPKQNKLAPVKREIEGMLVKKGAITKIANTVAIDAAVNKNKILPGTVSATAVTATTAVSNANKVDSDDEDFLLNEEVNETKRKLEKSFSDSDDEPLAIKAHVKIGDKDADSKGSKKSDCAPVNATTPLAMLPLTAKTVPTPTPPMTTTPQTYSNSNNTSPPVVTAQLINAAITQAPSPFKTIEKKSPVPTSKILNVPATYGIPSAASGASTSSVNVAINANFNKTTSTYLPQASPHYHASHARPTAAHQFSAIKSPTTPVAVNSNTTTATAHLNAPTPLPQQSPIKYQTPPTTYPPPIEAYPSPKINPNFLTPKFDRTTLPRSNNFPSPSPVKFDVPSATSKVGLAANTTLSPKTSTGSAVANPQAAAIVSNAASTSAAAAAVTVAAATTSNSTNDPLKDEIGSILAANLMPSKEESGKIFGIASVSLAQSSGPDNTKCTLGKCGSIHKPVLGPVVPTEGYIGDQLSSKERRKAKVNMTHEQIQKWLIECSSNPDEIQDDLEDDFDDNLRPNLFATTPPPTRDDKESTSFSSSSKATRDLGKSESAWSAKGPSLKATPVVATSNRKDDGKQIDVSNQMEAASDHEKTSGQAINLTHKINTKQSGHDNDNAKTTKDKPDKKTDKKPTKEDKATVKEAASKDNKQTRIDKDKDKDKEKEPQSNNSKSSFACKQSTTPVLAVADSSSTTTKSNRKKNVQSVASISLTPEDKAATAAPSNTQKTSIAGSNSNTNTSATKTPKRTPVYNQKTQKQIVELKETTTTSHKKTTPFSYGAFSADNEKSIYSFDKDDDEDGAAAAAAGTGAGGVAKSTMSKPTAFRRQSRRDSHPDDVNTTGTPSSRTSPTKKRAAAAAAEKANKDIANASQSSSVSLTLSPSENCKLVKVSLDAEKQKPYTSKANAKAAKKTEAAATNDADSDSDGHTFYIPLQGSGTGGDTEGGIQGVAVKLGREGPDGPNQKVIMHATLVTKAQMGSNSKPLPDSMNVSDIVKTLIAANSTPATTAATTSSESCKKVSNTNVTPSTSAAAAAAAAVNSSSNSLKNVPIGTVQPRFKASDAHATTSQQGAATAGTSSGLVRVNSNSSLLSGSAKSRLGAGATVGQSTTTPATPATAAATPAHTAATNKKFKDDTPIKMSNNTAFPRHDDPTQMVEAPIFRPTEKEFADPIEFIERITPIAARFGICKIIPPSTFKPECRISDEMRFTAYNQYVHKMLHRWGPSAKELSAIKKYLATQSIVMNHPPWIGGMEVDLPRLYHTVQELGGLKEVIEKKKWARVAEEMCIPKLAQDRVAKLDDIYCKYLLPYDTLSPAERQKLFDEVEADWAKREARARRNADRFVNTESVSNEDDDVSSEDDEESEEEVDGVSMECIVKGRSMPLSQFYRIARNTMALWFKNTEPLVNEVEAEFWRHVAVRDSHVCVHAGSIDSSGWGYGFPSPGPKGKGSNYARHPWNLKVLTNNPGSVLRSLGPVMGVTVPTLHVGMLFSACCWYRDPHGLSWIEYLHTGASKLWYGIPDDQSANFRAALTSLIPTHCQNKTIWLPCDTVMVPPHMLTDRGVSLCRIEQKPGEFIVVFPRAYTSSLATGYVVSESVYFATTSWLDLAKDDFRDIHDSCEPAMFSLEQLLFALGYDQRVTSDALQQMLPMLHEVFEKETAAREQLKAAGVTSTEKVHNEKGTKAKKQQPPFKSIESECDLCRANLYISMVRTEDNNVYCLQHALKNLNNGNIQAKHCKLIYAYNVEDVENLIKNLKDKIQQKRNAVVNKKVK